MKKKRTLSWTAWVSGQQRPQHQALGMGLSAYAKLEEFIEGLCGAGRMLGTVHLINTEM